MQNQLQPGDLLDSKGYLIESGYATEPVKIYDRAKIRANRFRIKEWDAYYISNQSHAFALAVTKIGCMGIHSSSLIDFDIPWEKMASRTHLLPMGKQNMPSTSLHGDIFACGKDYEITFQNSGLKRRLFGHFDDFEKGKPLLFDVSLTNPPRSSVVIVSPFAGRPKTFCYNQMINCITAEGRVEYDGQEYLFGRANSSAVLDWGRSALPHVSTARYWISGAGLISGKRFGFNLGYGFGDPGAADVNIVFYGGICHKLSNVWFDIPAYDDHENCLQSLHIASEDHRLEITFDPIIGRTEYTKGISVYSKQRRVFGTFNGNVVLDNGARIEMCNITGFLEEARRKK